MRRTIFIPKCFLLTSTLTVYPCFKLSRNKLPVDDFLRHETVPIHRSNSFNLTLFITVHPIQYRAHIIELTCPSDDGWTGSCAVSWMPCIKLMIELWKERTEVGQAGNPACDRPLGIKETDETAGWGRLCVTNIYFPDYILQTSMFVCLFLQKRDSAALIEFVAMLEKEVSYMPNAMCHVIDHVMLIFFILL